MFKRSSKRRVPVAAQSDGCFRPPCCAAAPAGEHESPPQSWSCELHSLCSPVKIIIGRCFKIQFVSLHFLSLQAHLNYMKTSAVLTCSSLRRSISSSTFFSVSFKSLFKCFRKKMTEISSWFESGICRSSNAIKVLFYSESASSYSRCLYVISFSHHIILVPNGDMLCDTALTVISPALNHWSSHANIQSINPD